MTTRALDALIAEHLFGYTRAIAPADARGEHGGCEYLRPPIMPDGYQLPRRGAIAFDFMVPRYSATIANAWPVVERMRERGEHLQLHVFPNRVRGSAQFGSTAYAHRESMPEAICAAALLALGVEVPR